MGYFLVNYMQTPSKVAVFFVQNDAQCCETNEKSIFINENKNKLLLTSCEEIVEQGIACNASMCFSCYSCVFFDVAIKTV